MPRPDRTGAALGAASACEHAIPALREQKCRGAAEPIGGTGYQHGSEFGCRGWSHHAVSSLMVWPPGVVFGRHHKLNIEDFASDAYMGAPLPFHGILTSNRARLFAGR